MKGILFTQFLDLMEDKFGLEMVDKVLSQSNLESKGIYTAFGTYPSSEFFILLQNLKTNTGISKEKLLEVYADYFFEAMKNNYGYLLSSYKDPIEMLASIENHIHSEIRKVYADAELPTFLVKEKTENSLIMIYKSSRAMYYFCLGLIKKVFEHFNTNTNILLEKIKDDGTEVRFIINKI